MVLYSLSLFLEWGSVLVLRYNEPWLPRPFVIPINNGRLVLYFSIPMGLCLWTIYSVISSAISDLYPCKPGHTTTDYGQAGYPPSFEELALPGGADYGTGIHSGNGSSPNSGGGACHRAEGLVTLLGIGGAFGLALMMYLARGCYWSAMGIKAVALTPEDYGIVGPGNVLGPTHGPKTAVEPGSKPPAVDHHGTETERLLPSTATAKAYGYHGEENRRLAPTRPTLQ